jgi:hypothetical protein
VPQLSENVVVSHFKTNRFQLGEKQPGVSRFIFKAHFGSGDIASASRHGAWKQ